MPQNIVEVRGAAGKTVEKITVTNEADFRMVTVWFADRTAIHFTLRPQLEIVPELLDWKTGDGQVVKVCPVIHEPYSEI